MWYICWVILYVGWISSKASELLCLDVKVVCNICFNLYCRVRDMEPCCTSPAVQFWLTKTSCPILKTSPPLCRPCSDVPVTLKAHPTARAAMRLETQDATLTMRQSWQTCRLDPAAAHHLWVRKTVGTQTTEAQLETWASWKRTQGLRMKLLTSVENGHSSQKTALHFLCMRCVCMTVSACAWRCKSWFQITQDNCISIKLNRIVSQWIHKVNILSVAPTVLAWKWMNVCVHERERGGRGQVIYHPLSLLISFSICLSFMFLWKNLTHHECLKDCQKWGHFWHYLREFITGAKGKSRSFLLNIYLCLPLGKHPLYLITTYTYVIWLAALLR